MINSRDLNELDDVVMNKVNAFLTQCKAKGIDILVTSTYRDFDSQAALYAQGRTKKGPKVTNAKPGYSWHNWRRAIDIVPLVNGKPCWKTTGPELKLWNLIGEIGESVGLEWAGRWTTFKELAHFQDTQGLDKKKLLAQYPKGLPAKKAINEDPYFNWDTLLGE